MNERFILIERKSNEIIIDTENSSWYNEDKDYIEILGDGLTNEDIVNLLNEQDKKINELEHKLNFHHLINIY